MIPAANQQTKSNEEVEAGLVAAMPVREDSTVWDTQNLWIWNNTDDS